MSLLEKLDKAFQADPSPDSVAQRLLSGDWMEAEDFSREYWAEHNASPHVIAAWRQNEKRWAVVYGCGPTDNWTPRGYRPNRDSVVFELGQRCSTRYRFILTANYKEGDLPPCLDT
jgi:hypothetical protein